MPNPARVSLARPLADTGTALPPLSWFQRVASMTLVPIIVLTEMRIGMSTRVPSTGASQTDRSRLSLMNCVPGRSGRCPATGR